MPILAHGYFVTEVEPIRRAAIEQLPDPPKSSATFFKDRRQRPGVVWPSPAAIPRCLCIIWVLSEKARWRASPVGEGHEGIAYAPGNCCHQCSPAALCIG